MLEVANIPMPDGQIPNHQFFQQQADEYDLVEEQEPEQIYNVGLEQQQNQDDDGDNSSNYQEEIEAVTDNADGEEDEGDQITQNQLQE